jgi:hypothetical protein
MGRWEKKGLDASIGLDLGFERSVSLLTNQHSTYLKLLVDVSHSEQS